MFLLCFQFTFWATLKRYMGALSTFQVWRELRSGILVKCALGFTTLNSAVLSRKGFYVISPYLSFPEASFWINFQGWSLDRHVPQLSLALLYFKAFWNKHRAGEAPAGNINGWLKGLFKGHSPPQWILKMPESVMEMAENVWPFYLSSSEHKSLLICVSIAKKKKKIHQEKWHQSQDTDILISLLCLLYPLLSNTCNPRWN